METLHVPETVPVMTLPNTVFFPQALLPLHIFEPRYQEMLRDVLATNRIFAVAHLDTDRRQKNEASEPLHHIASIGIVRACQKDENNTSNLLLHGVIRVRFVDWLDAPYPKARIEPIPSIFEPETQSRAALEALHEAAEAVTRELPDEVRETLNAMTAQIDDPSILADVMAQQFVHDPDERQDLLEMESAAARVAWICKKFESGAST